MSNRGVTWSQQFLMEATGTDTIERAWAVLQGRPPLSPEGNETIRVRDEG
jgi:hypothetical protein